MRQVNIHEAKTQLSKVIQEALDGAEIIIARDNTPLVRLDVLPEARPDRRIGGARGLLLSMAPDFDAPLDDFADYTGTIPLPARCRSTPSTGCTLSRVTASGWNTFPSITTILSTACWSHKLRWKTWPC